MTERAIELMPCPFCNEDNTLFSEAEHKDERRYVEMVLECCSCEIQMAERLGFSRHRHLNDAEITRHLKAELVRRWNTRTPSSLDSGKYEGAGWRTVPVEPTIQMLQAGYLAFMQAYKSQVYGEALMSKAWDAALAAAPPSPGEGTKPEPLIPGETITVKIPEGYDTAWDFLHDCGLEAVYPADGDTGVREALEKP